MDTGREAEESRVYDGIGTLWSMSVVSVGSAIIYLVDGWMVGWLGSVSYTHLTLPTILLV